MSRTARRRARAIDELCHLLESGVISPSSLVWHARMERWQPASQIAELFPIIGSSPPEVPANQRSSRATNTAGLKALAWALAFGSAFVAVSYGQQWLQENDNNPGLIGELRSHFVQSAISSCVKSFPADKKDLLEALSPSLISQTCTCYANGLADRLSFNELKSIDPQNPEKTLGITG